MKTYIIRMTAAQHAQLKLRAKKSKQTIKAYIIKKTLSGRPTKA